MKSECERSYGSTGAGRVKRRADCLVTELARSICAFALGGWLACACCRRSEELSESADVPMNLILQVSISH